MACTTGCPTKDCESYAACLRGKGSRVAYANSASGYDFSKEKAWNRELDAYATARAEGIQPAGTTMRDIDAARKASDRQGFAYDAGRQARV